MIQQSLEIRTQDGLSEALIFRPDGKGPWPGVIHLTDIGGLRPSQSQMAGRLAAEGYVVLMPNVFYRVARPPVIDAAARASDELKMKRIAELSAALPPGAMDRDAVAYVDFLSGQKEVRPGLMGVVGYCFTGAMAMRMAAACADRIAAAASFHGGRLYEDSTASPHVILPRIKGRLYFGHAVNDRSMPPEAIEKFNLALESWGGRYESEVYDGAYHSWTVPDSPVYNQPQAERAYNKLKELFAETLR